MSRSRKKNPIYGIVGDNPEKKDKRIANRKLRTSTRNTLKHIVKNIEYAEDLDQYEFGHPPTAEAVGLIGAGVPPGQCRGQVGD